jgi:glucose-6-phosphate isomerase
VITELITSGLPLYFNAVSNLLALSAPLLYNGYGTKNAGQMRGLLADERNLPTTETCYDVYRRIRNPEDQELLEKKQFSYDITIIMDGEINGERKKTSGHYHGYNPEHTATYPEVYEVIKGTALYVMQRADNFDSSPENVDIDDLILAVVKEGETIIIPPNYGHCSVNVGTGPLIFSNLAFIPCPIHYDPVKHYHGMSYYIMKEQGKLKVTANGHHSKKPPLKFARVKENPKLGITFGIPVYQSFRKNPDAFDYLGKPDVYRDKIMSMLDMKQTLEEVL